MLILGNNSLRHLGIPKDELNEFGIDQFKNYLRQKIIKKENFGDFTEKVVEHISNFYLNYDKPEKLDNWFYLERIVYVCFFQIIIYFKNRVLIINRESRFKFRFNLSFKLEFPQLRMISGHFSVFCKDNSPSNI